MQWWQSLILGIVEGLTEYLPVSSTGHLLLTQKLLHIDNGDLSNAFAICIQAGAIVAVLGLYWRHTQQMLAGMVGRNPQGLQLLSNLLTAFVPAGIIGFLFDKRIEQVLFGLWPVAFAWAMGALAIFYFANQVRFADPHYGRALTKLKPQQAFIIGLAQCLAMWPGTSRSLVTIIAAVLVGLSVPAAIEFSFLLGVITLGAATAYKGWQHGSEMLNTYGPGTLAVGFLSAWLSATIAVKWMVHYLQKHRLTVFAYWRLAMAIFVTIYLV
jgi:undecaprenyl-diphosphatase